MIKADKLPFHYGWLIVFACGMGAFIILPQIFTVPGLYVVHITKDLGVARTVHSFSITLQITATAITVLFLKRLTSRFPINRIMTATAVMLGLNLMSYSVLSSVAGLYIRAIINGISVCLAGNMIMTLLIQRWFVKSLNFAMSLAFTCTGLGGMVFSQILSRVLIGYGWRSCYFVSGVSVMLLLVPVYFFILKDSPEQIGLQPFGAQSLKGVTIEAPRSTGVTLKEAQRHWYFYVFIVSIAVVSISSSCTQSHFPPSLYDSGYAIATVAVIQSIYSVLNSVTKLSIGVIFDKIGAKVGLFIVLMGYCVGYMALAFASLAQPLGFIAGIGFGLGIAWTTLGIPFVVASIFGRKDYAGVYGFCTMVTQMASAIATTGAGMVYDLAGSYFIIWITLSICCLLAFGVFMLGLVRRYFFEPVHAD